MKNKIKETYDLETDTKWIILKDGPEAYFIEIAPGFNLEFDEKSNLIGIEIQNFSRFFNFDSNVETSQISIVDVGLSTSSLIFKTQSPEYKTSYD